MESVKLFLLVTLDQHDVSSDVSCGYQHCRSSRCFSGQHEIARCGGISTASGNLFSTIPHDFVSSLVKFALQPVAKSLARPGSNIMFVRSETQPGTSTEEVPVASNPDEIDIDEDGEDDEEEEATIEEQQVPRQVFGSLKKDDEDEEDAQ